MLYGTDVVSEARYICALAVTDIGLGDASQREPEGRTCATMNISRSPAAAEAVDASRLQGRVSVFCRAGVARRGDSTGVSGTLFYVC